MKSKIMGTVSLAAVLALGCDEPPEQQGPIALGGPLDGGSAPLDGGEGSEPSADGSSILPADGSTSETMPVAPPASTGPTYAVVNSDWKTTVISILDPLGAIVADNYIHSGSAKAALVTALSGDVELPKRSGEPGVLVLVDRFKTDVITRIRLADGALLGQVKTHTPATETTGTAFTSNPYDYVYIDAQTAWITRNQPNLDPAAPEIDRGDDLFRINPSTMERAGERIDLWSLDAKVLRTDVTTGAAMEVTAHARPGRMVRLGQTLVVGIARTAYDFKAVGPGVIAIVDLTTKTVTGFDLTGLKNCGTVNAIPNDVDSVLVTCTGDFTADARETAGLAIVGVSHGAARLESVWRAKDDPSPRPFTAATVSLGGSLVGVAAHDYSGKGPDIFALVDVATGTRTELMSVTPGSGRFGTPAYDAERGLLLLPDASMDADKKPTAGLRRFQRGADGTFTELAMTRVASSTGLPVRHVYPL